MFSGVDVSFKNSACGLVSMFVRRQHLNPIKNQKIVLFPERRYAVMLQKPVLISDYNIFAKKQCLIKTRNSLSPIVFTKSTVMSLLRVNL